MNFYSNEENGSRYLPSRTKLLTIANSGYRKILEGHTLVDNVEEWAESLSNNEPMALNQLMSETRPAQLVKMVDRWRNNESAWSVSEKVRYFQLGVVPRGHRVVVRRLIRSAAEKQQNKVMAAAFVYVDHLNETSAFSFRTTAYLKRFMWRYMRSLAAEGPNLFCKTLSAALRAYPASLEAWNSLCLRRWCLMKACFGNHPSIKFTSQHASVHSHLSLATLAKSRSQMPYQEHWESDVGQRELKRLAIEAQSIVIVEWASNQIR